jgi:NAD+ diphosphatase
MVFAAPANVTISNLEHPITESGSEWIVARDRELLVAVDNASCLPQSRPAMDLPVIQALATLNGTSFIAAAAAPSAEAPPGWQWTSLRALFGVLDEDRISLAGRAVQLLDWELSNAFCGKCGRATSIDRKERCARCTACGLTIYPRLEPAVIVAVTREPREILLASSSRLPNRMYSVLAGFVEPGETLEQCVEREVFEEAGIRVKNPRYFGSQPWPFPRSLMIGFTAEYASGELNIDETELKSADWFSLDDLPQVPSLVSISRALIDFVKAGQRG